MRAQNHGLIAAALAAGLATGATDVSAQQDYRLAFSKAENIEVFVEGATKDTWCAPMLGLRAVHGGAPDTAGLGRLLPRLGALFKQQCPQTTAVSWRSVDATGRQFAQGHSLAQDGWRMVATAPAAAAPPVAVVPTPAPATPPVAVAPVPTTPPAAALPTPAPVAPPVAEAPVPTPSTPPVAVAPAPAPVASSVAAPAPAPVAPAPVAPPVVATPTPAPAVPPPAPAATPPTPGLQNFAVGGWLPPTGAQQAELLKFLTTVQNQNACKFVLALNIGNENPARMSLVSEGDITCGADGYAQGKGRLRLIRSDGALIDRTNDVWLSHGLVFDVPVQGLRATDIVAVNESRYIWLGMGSDAASQSHYLMQARPANRLGVWRFRNSTAILTVNTEAFRQAQSIRDMIDGFLAFAPSVLPEIDAASIEFSDGVKGIFNDDADHSLYSINARRSSRRNRGVMQFGEWHYDLSNGRNYLFEREARFAERKRQEDERKRREEELLARQQQQEAERLARQKRQEEERLARQQQQEAERLARIERQAAERQERERRNQLIQLARVEVRNLRQYQELLELEQQKDGSQTLRKRLERDVSYSPLPDGAYFDLMRSQWNTVQRIVRVDGSKDDDAVVDWPYPMLLAQQNSLEKGWYWIRGQRRLDRDVLDDDGFPMTVVMLNGVKDAQVHACEARGCSDLLTALGLMRMQLNQPDWTPEAAQAVIDEVPEDEKWRL